MRANVSVCRWHAPLTNGFTLPRDASCSTGVLRERIQFCYSYPISMFWFGIWRPIEHLLSRASVHASPNAAGSFCAKQRSGLAFGHDLCVLSMGFRASPDIDELKPAKYHTKNHSCDAFPQLNERRRVADPCLWRSAPAHCRQKPRERHFYNQNISELRRKQSLRVHIKTPGLSCCRFGRQPARLRATKRKPACWPAAMK